MKNLGKCPYCDDGTIEVKEIKYSDQSKGKIFKCSNIKYDYDESVTITLDSKCRYQIFSNCLSRYNKKHLGENEVKRMLQDGDVEVILHSRKGFIDFEELNKQKANIDFSNSNKKNNKVKKIHKEYTKKIIPNLEYGIEILF
jgi:predicted nucleic-acid-binding Zn-ribbon protein